MVEKTNPEAKKVSMAKNTTNIWKHTHKPSKLIYIYIFVISMAAARMSSKLIVETLEPARKWIVNKVITYGL